MTTKAETKWLGTRERYTGTDGQTRWKWRVGRLALVAGSAFVISYLAAVTGGYFWLREARGAKSLTFGSVALFQLREMKRSIAETQVAEARGWVAKKEYQKAYVAFVSALRSDSTNADLRLEVANFLASVRANQQAAMVLEQGLPMARNKVAVGERLLALLRSQNLDDRILQVVRGPLAAELNSPRGRILREYEIEASLNVEGPTAASKLLAAHREVAETDEGARLGARALWAADRKGEAVKMLADTVSAGRGTMGTYQTLFEYQEQVRQMIDAQQTAAQAAKRFPSDPAAQLLSIASRRGVNLPATGPWREEVERFLGRFGDKPEAVVSLAETAGRRGWVDLTFTLYSGSLAEGRVASTLALCYADSLLAANKPGEARRVLDELNAQVGDDPGLAVYVRSRQVIAAAASGATLAMREHARGLGLLLASDPAQLDATRKRFIRVGLTEAAAELGGAKAAQKTKTRTQ